MDLYVRCTLEYLDTSSTKYFSGKFFVDSGEGSFTVIEFKPDGKKEEVHKFFAHEFLPLGRPPSKSTAQQYSLDFDISKQPPGRLHKRKRKLHLRTADHSQKIKDIYEELKEMFSKKPQNARLASSSTTSPVGMLRSRPDPTKISRLEHRHRPPKFIFDDSPPRGGPGLFSSESSCKKPSSTTSNKNGEPRSVPSQTSIILENSLDCTKSSEGPVKVVRQEIGRPSSSNDIIEIASSGPSRSSTAKTSKPPSKPSSVVGVRNSISEESAKSGASNSHTTEQSKETYVQSSIKFGFPGSRSKESPKEPQSQRSRKPSDQDKSSQGSIISLIEQKSLESSTIRVTAPFKARPHTVTFKQKRNDSSPPKPSLAKRLASDFRKEPIPNDATIDLDGLSSPSFYGSSRPTSSNKQAQRRPGEIVSPRAQLLADSISSSRCLISPPSGPKGTTNSSLYMNRDAVTPSRKRKETDEPSSRDFVDVGISDNLSPSTSDQHHSPYSYRGLENLTNSCYMNATLQALASVFPFYYRMQMIQQRREEGGYECSEFVRRFNDVLHNLVSPDRDADTKYGSATKVSVLQALKVAAGKELGSDPDFGSNSQQDAHEFLAKTLEILEKEALRKKRSHLLNNERTRSPHAEQSASAASSSRNPAGVFQHKIRDRYGCERCARASEMTNDAIDLTVTVSAGESIQKMIENALAREEIEYKCDHCGTGAGFISRAFATLPQSLIVVVKRYRFGEAGGSKVEERIGVSRELFLKDLFVDSEVKRQEGVARRSLSRSVEPYIGDPREDGRSDDSGVISEAESVSTTAEERTENSRKSQGSVIANASVMVMDHDQVQESVFENSRGSDAMETCESARSTAESHLTIDKHLSAECSLTSTAVEKSRTPTSIKGSSLDHAGVADQPSMLSRLALSPIKMNRAVSAKEDKLCDSFASPRKLMVVENMDLDASSATSFSECIIEDPEKENAVFNPLKLGPEVEGTVIKQSGGYLKETTPDLESARSGGSSTASREVADIPNDTGSASTQSDDNVLEKDVNSLKLTDNTDVPSKRARLENNIDAGAAGLTKPTTASISTEPSTSYARQMTEPLRPSTRTPKYKQPPTTPLLEQISVVGEVEEKVTLVFRPVIEERQKLWCQRFGFKYIGSPERRMKMFGREIEFSLRDVPQSCEVRGDGNCLFRTLSWWITGGSEKEYFRLREKLISFMAKYRAKFSSLLLSQQDMDSHLERMSEDGEWGTQVELAAAACWLGVNIYTFLEGKWLRYRPLFRWSMDGTPPVSISRDECNDERGAIFICNASGCHFQPAVSVEPHFTRRNLRPRREREFVKETSPVRGTPDPPYVFNVADGPVYSLSAVICHHGDSLLTGHYSTFALDATRREWLDCNDHIITKVSELEVIDNSSSSGYIFIYNRVEDPLRRL